MSLLPGILFLILAVDFLCLYILKNKGLQSAKETVCDIPEDALELVQGMDLTFYERVNCNFVEKGLPIEMQQETKRPAAFFIILYPLATLLGLSGTCFQTGKFFLEGFNRFILCS